MILKVPFDEVFLLTYNRNVMSFHRQMKFLKYLFFRAKNYQKLYLQSLFTGIKNSYSILYHKIILDFFNSPPNTTPTTNSAIGSDDVIRKMIAEEINAFELDWSDVLKRGRQLSIQIGTKDEMTASSKQLTELQDISNQATESTDALTMEIQTLRMSLNETFSMVTEAKAKRAMFENMEYVVNVHVFSYH